MTPPGGRKPVRKVSETIRDRERRLNNLLVLGGFGLGGELGGPFFGGATGHKMALSGLALTLACASVFAGQALYVAGAQLWRRWRG
jgi:hypothetical protein